jgi:hypothetical protein
LLPSLIGDPRLLNFLCLCPHCLAADIRQTKNHQVPTELALQKGQSATFDRNGTLRECYVPRHRLARLPQRRPKAGSRADLHRALLYCPHSNHAVPVAFVTLLSPPMRMEKAKNFILLSPPEKLPVGPYQMQNLGCQALTLLSPRETAVVTPVVISRLSFDTVVAARVVRYRLLNAERVAREHRATLSVNSPRLSKKHLRVNRERRPCYTESVGLSARALRSNLRRGRPG